VICGQLTFEGKCEGTLVPREEVGVLLELQCRKCGTWAALPLLKVRPEVRRQQRMQAAALPSKFRGKRFERTPENESSVAKVTEWLAGFSEHPLPAPALWGGAGHGKSHLLAAISARLISEADVSVAFFSARSLLRQLQDFEKADVRDAVWKRAAEVDVLALDDVGAQQQTDWRNDQLADLIDVRYENDRSIVIATNFPLSMWGDMFDERTVSRLRWMTFPVELCGTDRRVQGE